mgnify:FL=1
MENKETLALQRILLMLHKKHLSYVDMPELGEVFRLAICAETLQMIQEVEKMCQYGGIMTEQHLLAIKTTAQMLHDEQKARELEIAAYEQSIC